MKIQKLFFAFNFVFSSGLVDRIQTDGSDYQLLIENDQRVDNGDWLWCTGAVESIHVNKNGLLAVRSSFADNRHLYYCNIISDPVCSEWKDLLLTAYAKNERIKGTFIIQYTSQ